MTCIKNFPCQECGAMNECRFVGLIPESIHRKRLEDKCADIVYDALVDWGMDETYAFDDPNMNMDKWVKEFVRKELK